MTTPYRYRHTIFGMRAHESGEYVRHDAAERVCQTYFDIAAGAAGEDLVRKLRDERIAELPFTATGDDELLQLRAENAVLRKQLSQRVLDETVVHELAIKDGGLYAGIQGGAAGLLAMSFGDTLLEYGAENYVEMQFTYKGERLTVTLQRQQGLTPHQLRVQAISALADLVSAIEGASIAGFGVIEAEGMEDAVMAACTAVGKVMAAHDSQASGDPAADRSGLMRQLANLTRRDIRVSSAYGELLRTTTSLISGLQADVCDQVSAAFERASLVIYEPGSPHGPHGSVAANG